MQQTFEQFKNIYYNKLISLDPNITPDIQGTDSYFKANAVSQIGTQLVQDLLETQNQIIPASSSGNSLSRHAGSLGMLPLFPALPSVGVVSGLIANSGTTATATVTIPQGTKLNNFISGNSYITTQDVQIVSGATLASVILPIQSINLGSNTYSAVNSEMTFDTPVAVGVSQKIVSGTLTTITIGSDMETSNEFASRILEFMISPRGGGSSGDYKKWGFLGSSNIRNVEVITSYSANYGILFPILFVGSNNPNDYITQNVSFPINRVPDNSTIAAVNSYMNGVRPINDNPFGIGAYTYSFITPDPVFGGEVISFNVVVTLSQGLSLSTNITLTDGSYLTIQNAILREFRRAIISTKPYGTLVDIGVNPDYYILTDDIENIIIIGLGNTQTIQGNFASILTSINISFVGGAEDPTNYVRIPSIIRNNILVQGDGQVDGAYLVYDIQTNTSLPACPINISLAS